MSVSLKNKIVFITGASSGIGQAAAVQFAQQGAKLIITARRLDRLKSLADKLKSEFKVDVLALELDVQNYVDVDSVVTNLPKEWREIDILVNNAGLALDLLKIQDGDPAHWDTMIQTNICGLLYVTRAILPGMVKRNSGHIVNIGSVAGHDVYPMGNVYSATKHAVRAISKSTRMDLLGTSVRLTEIAPGAVNTEFSTVRWNDKKRADDFYKDFQPLVANDIADAIIYCTTRPAHINIAELVIYPTAQASVAHIHRTV